MTKHRNGSVAHRMSLLEVGESTLFEVPRKSRVSTFESSILGSAATRAGIRIKRDLLIAVDLDDRQAVDVIRVTRAE